MDAVTFFGGIEYKHKDFTTAVKQKDLPQEVKDAITNSNKQI
jgi:hypothetical protein